MIGFSDFLVILGCFFLNFCLNARTINTNDNMIIVYSTLNINIMLRTKNPLAEWFYLFRVSPRPIPLELIYLFFL